MQASGNALFVITDVCSQGTSFAYTASNFEKSGFEVNKKRKQYMLLLASHALFPSIPEHMS